VQCDLPKCGPEKKFICHPCRVEHPTGPVLSSWGNFTILERGVRRREVQGGLPMDHDGQGQVNHKGNKAMSCMITVLN
jgi:hypothetical protein